MAKLERLNITLPSEVLEELRAISKRGQIPVTVLVRMAVYNYLEQANRYD